MATEKQWVLKQQFKIPAVSQTALFLSWNIALL